MIVHGEIIADPLVYNLCVDIRIMFRFCAHVMRKKGSNMIQKRNQIDKKKVNMAPKKSVNNEL